MGATAAASNKQLMGHVRHLSTDMCAHSRTSATPSANNEVQGYAVGRTLELMLKLGRKRHQTNCQSSNNEDCWVCVCVDARIRWR
eukprot:15449719-Alexandrium_andersonii.AAC.1